MVNYRKACLSLGYRDNPFIRVCCALFKLLIGMKEAKIHDEMKKFSSYSWNQERIDGDLK
jgi:hypothetical protein